MAVLEGQVRIIVDTSKKGRPTGRPEYGVSEFGRTSPQLLAISCWNPVVPNPPLTCESYPACPCFRRQYSSGEKGKVPRLGGAWYDLGVRGYHVDSEDAVKAYKDVAR